MEYNTSIKESKKRDRDIEFEDFYDSNSTTSKYSNNSDKYYDQDESDPFSQLTQDQVMEHIKKSIHKNDLDMFKIIVDNYELSETEIYEVVELLLSTKFFEALVHFTEICDAVRDIISEDFETIIEEYGLNEDSITYYFDCFPKKMFKILIYTDNGLFSDHVRQPHNLYLLHQIKSYIDNKKSEIHDKQLFLNNIRTTLTQKMIDTFNYSDYKCNCNNSNNNKKDFVIFELIYDIIGSEYFNANEFNNYEKLKTMYLKYKQNKSICDMLSNVKI